MRVRGRCRDFHSGPKAVVEHGLGLAVAIGIEAAAHMRQAVPLGGVLRVHQQHVVANHVGKQRVFRSVGPAVALRAGALTVAQRGVALRGQPPGVQRHAARQVERQRQAECSSLLNFGNALQDFFASNQVHAAALVVRAEFAPIAAVRRVLPSLRHDAAP
ncbi:hypothetical protein D3C86_1796130 [compost metagenome]